MQGTYCRKPDEIKPKFSEDLAVEVIILLR